MRRKNSGKKLIGFTIIELLIVAGVLIIFSAWVYPQVARRQKLSKIRACYRQFMVVEMAQFMHYSDFNAYAVSNAELLNHFHTTSNNNLSYLNYHRFSNAAANAKGAHCTGFLVTTSGGSNQTWFSRVEVKGGLPACSLRLNVTAVGAPPAFTMVNCPTWISNSDVQKN